MLGQHRTWGNLVDYVQHATGVHTLDLSTAITKMKAVLPQTKTLRPSKLETINALTFKNVTNEWSRTECAQILKLVMAHLVRALELA